MTHLLQSAALVLRLLGCDEPAPEVPAAPAATAPAPAAPVAPVAPTVPRTKQHEATPRDRVGTLPEGVGVAVGEAAPDARLTGLDGATVHLAELYAAGPALVVFYRGGWCPYCNFQVRELVTRRADLAARGLTPVLISVDRVEEAARTGAAYEIPFPVLSDPDLVAHRAFRVTHEVDEETRARYRGFGIDLERASGRDHHTIAIPSVFAVDAEGHVRFAHADRDYRTRPTVDQLLVALDAAGFRPLSPSEAGHR